MDCTETIEKEVCIEAKVKVIPEAEAGDVKLKFIGEPKREPCEETLSSECDFVISQMICLKIPIQFSAEAEVVRKGIVCENKNHDCEPNPCDDMREHKHFMIRRDDPESEPARSFARNYRLTYQNNPEPE